MKKEKTRERKNIYSSNAENKKKSVGANGCRMEKKEVQKSVWHAQTKQRWRMEYFFLVKCAFQVVRYWVPHSFSLYRFITWNSSLWWFFYWENKGEYLNALLSFLLWNIYWLQTTKSFFMLIWVFRSLSEELSNTLNCFYIFYSGKI